MRNAIAMRHGWIPIALALLHLFTFPARTQIHRPQLALRGVESNGWTRLETPAQANTVITLHASTNLSAWETVGTVHDALRNFPDPGAAGNRHRYYRALAAPRGAANDWKNQIVLPNDPFLTANIDSHPRWVKFAIVLDEPSRVYYQDSVKYPFHYEFATLRLPQFARLSRSAFDAVSLRRASQQAVLGAVLVPPFGDPEYGVQLVGLDPYPVEDAVRWLELVRATVHSAEPAGVFYMPAFEQDESARANEAFFAERGFTLAGLSRWSASPIAIYSDGWAFGRLKFFAATNVAAAFSNGQLRPEDLLLTDGVPADMPIVAGIITLAPATPNSHVAILAQSFRIPFVYFQDAADRARVLGLAGRKVILTAFAGSSVPSVRLLDAEGQFTADFEAELLAAKTPEPIHYLPKEHYGSISAPADNLTPADIRFFGGKAANYGFLRREVPSNAPVAIALSFDLWEAFLDQPVPGGMTLRAAIAQQLAPFTNFPPDIPLLKSRLAVVRNLITKTAAFTSLQRQAIISALAPFDPNRKIRFRSSTNVEDSEQFTGAGLYDSFSGCLLDDMDGDNAGPSACDPEESEERGVFRAIQKVYASFYNDDAFLERLRYGVTEDNVGMGVLVHHSFPDEWELANGVATLDFTVTQITTNFSGQMVTQLGAESVANPNGGSIPEIVAASRLLSTSRVRVRQYSSLTPLGQAVMGWEDDYQTFLQLFGRIGRAFREFYPLKTRFRLNYEYKKDAHLGLVVKQVREIPTPSVTNVETAFLINEPANYRILQGEAGTVFGLHRLKSLWFLQSRNMRMTSTNLAQGFHADCTVQYVSNGTVQTLSGPMNSWPDGSPASGSSNTWTTGTGSNLWHWRLNTSIITEATGGKPPFYTLPDFSRTVSVNYSRPLRASLSDDTGGFATTTNDSALLLLAPADPVSNRSLTRGWTNGAVRIQTTYYLAESLITGPLLSFAETRITGLTANEIVLASYFSQTYRPGHHNWTEDFLFEPRLDPSVSEAALNELASRNIQMIHATYALFGGPASVHFIGFDDSVRPP